MKRNFDLMRKILIDIEESNPVEMYTQDFFDLSDDFDELSYNIQLLYEAGFINAYDISTCDGSYYPQYQINWITNAGHDYLDSIRSESIWNKTKQLFFEKSLSMTFGLIQEVATKLIKSQLGI